MPSNDLPNTAWSVTGNTCLCQNAVRDVHYLLLMNEGAITEIKANVVIGDYQIENCDHTK